MKKLPNTPKEIYVDGKVIKFHYNRAERLGKVHKEEKTENCFLCKRNMGIGITMLNIVLVIVLTIFFSKSTGKLNYYNDNGLQFFISKKYFTQTSEFNFQIKNISKNLLKLEKKRRLFEILDDKEKVVFYKEIEVSKREFRPNEYYVENIVTDKLNFGNYKAIFYVDIEKIIKIELKFSVR